MWPNVNDVFIVNGEIYKGDANFVGGMSFDQIGDTGIFLGPYPMDTDDITILADAGITGLIALQTDIDF